MSSERRTNARRKRRSFQQIMEDDSGKMLRAVLPPEWVIHGYAPDYGVDGTVEVFEFVDEDGRYAETLGEMFLFQLKSVGTCDVQPLQLHPRYNVEKGPYRRTDGDPVDVEVIAFQLDTDELLTIEGIGSGLVVCLFLVCLDSGRVFFVNLTDYVDKILTPESPDWRDQRSKVIHVPVLNELTPRTPLLDALRFYGARPKLMGAFAKIHFQWAELGHGRLEHAPDAWHAMAAHFVETLLRLDVWDQPAWALLTEGHEQLEAVRGYLGETDPSSVDQAAVVDLWFRLDTIARTWEEVAREWGLPTQLGHISSYPPSWLDDEWRAVPPEERT
jgi:uncharacterized protein DUF4365